MAVQARLSGIQLGVFFHPEPFCDKGLRRCKAGRHIVSHLNGNVPSLFRFSCSLLGFFLLAPVRSGDESLNILFRRNSLFFWPLFNLDKFFNICFFLVHASVKCSSFFATTSSPKNFWFFFYSRSFGFQNNDVGIFFPPHMLSFGISQSG